MEERVRTSKAIMDSIWSQPSAIKETRFPVIETIRDLVEALADGWAYNANEGDNIYAWFGDIRMIKEASSGNALGFGVVAPDGAPIRDGRNLVDWQDFHWAGVLVSSYLSSVTVPTV